jgi:hypothetical protein
MMLEQRKLEQMMLEQRKLEQMMLEQKTQGPHETTFSLLQIITRSPPGLQTRLIVVNGRFRHNPFPLLLLNVPLN